MWGVCSDTNNDPYLKSDFAVQSNTNGIKVTRVISHCTQRMVSWSESCVDTNGVVISNVVTNVFYGLIANTVYQVTDNGTLRYTMTSDVDGSISFAITLTNETHNLSVQGASAITMFNVR